MPQPTLLRAGALMPTVTGLELARGCPPPASAGTGFAGMTASVRNRTARARTALELAGREVRPSSGWVGACG
ncbi:MAG: hypothetical protein AAF170_19800, partial [Bacteroidota bacterium]